MAMENILGVVPDSACCWHHQLAGHLRMDSRTCIEFEMGHSKNTPCCMCPTMLCDAATGLLTATGPLRLPPGLPPPLPHRLLQGPRRTVSIEEALKCPAAAAPAVEDSSPGPDGSGTPLAGLLRLRLPSPPSADSLSAGNAATATALGLGAPFSCGSVGHPEACAGPCKYASKTRGCKDGAACQRCHLCRWNRTVDAKKKVNPQSVEPTQPPVIVHVSGGAPGGAHPGRAAS